VVEDEYVGFGEVADLRLIDAEAKVIEVIKLVEELGEVAHSGITGKKGI
jgi:hypothetical protein